MKVTEDQKEAVKWMISVLQHPDMQPRLKTPVLENLDKLIDLKNECKETFAVTGEPEDQDRTNGIIGRLSSFIEGADELKKLGQEGTPIPGDFSIVLGNAMVTMFERIAR